MVTFLASDERKHDADAAWRAIRDGVELAACSLWWSDPPQSELGRLGLVGHFQAGDREAGVALLGHACEELKAGGCTVAVGPMDGSTWRRYRLLTERGNEPAFLLEPDNPDEWPGWFTEAGFEALATYTSAVAEDLEAEDPRAERVRARLLREGFRIRALDIARFESELQALYEVSIAAFADNVLYKPISEAEFLDLYRPVRPLVRPELVLIAEKGGEPAAYLFAIPDQTPGTFIIKTLAAHPKYSGRGLGTVLILEANRAAARLGFRRAIHALMHEANQSTRISARQARVFRRYTLYSRSL